MRKKQKQAFLFLLSAVTAAQLGLAYGAATPDALTKGTWAYENGSWKFYNENQMPLTGWVKSVSGWYYLNPADGEMVNGWQSINGIRYYFNTAADGLDGQMRTGWYQAPDKSWYFFNNADTDASVGSMLTGWQWIDGYCYYFNPAEGADYGKMLSNTTTADGYQLNADGRWVGENGSVQYRQGAGFLTSRPVSAGYATGGGGGSSSGGGSSNGGQTQTTYRYVLMNIPYADFYEAELSNNSVDVDAVSSATKNKTRTGSLVGGSYHKNADGTDISGVTFPVRVSSKIDLSAYDTVTDASKITITVTNRGQKNTTDYVGRDALFEADDYAYYALPAGETPSYYKDMTIGADGKPNFSAVKGEAKEETALKPILKTETNYGDYQLDFENLPESITNDENTKVYGVVLHTKEGEDYGLRHLENIWRRQELAWSAGFVLQAHGNPLSAAHYKTLMGKNINGITYYTNQGILNFDLTEDVYVPIKFTAGLSFGKDGAGTADADAGKDGLAIQGLEDMPEDFDALYTVTDTAGQEAASFTANEESIKWEGTPTAGKYTLTVTDNSGKYAPISGSFVLQTEEAAAKAEQKEDKTWTLAAADGVSDETFKTYLKSITSVTVDGTKHNASGRGSVSIINQETGEIKLDAKKNGQNLFEAGKTYQMSVQATGWKNDLTFEMKVEKAAEQPGETKIYKGEASVEPIYGMAVSGTYQAKVQITVDADGKIVKIEDDGTGAGGNASFWENAKNGKEGVTGMFDRLTQKTKEEVEKLDTAPREDHSTPADAVSGATISSNAIKEAVLNAFGNEPETPEQPEEGTNMTALKMTVDGKEYTYYYKKDTSTILEPEKEPLMVGGVDVTDKAFQIRDNNDYSLKVDVYVPDGQKLPETLYGTADVPYAEFYLAEKMKNDETSKPELPSLGAEHMGVKMLREGGYDAVSSATTGKYGRFAEASYGELRSEGDKAGYEINGVKTPVAINGELYAAVKILAASGAAEANSLADMVDSMTLSEKDAEGNTAERALSTEEPAAYKKILSDGTLSALENSGSAKQLDTSETKVSLTTESRYGHYQLDFENLPKEISGTDNVLGVVITTGSMPSDVYGLEHLENIWFNASELAVAVKDGFETHGNKIDFQRYETLQGETIRSITFLLKDYQKVELDGLDLYCPQLLEDGQGVTAEDANLVNGKDTEVNLKISLPETYKVKLASVTASGEEVPADAYTFDAETGALTFKADSVKAGQYSLRIEDESGKYQPVSLSFVLNSSLAADEVSLKDNQLVISGESGVTAADYLAAVSTAAVDGSPVRARGVKLGELLFNEDGSVNFDAETTGRDGSKTKIFKDGAEGSYTLKLEAPGYPSVEGKVGKEGGTVTPPAENKELEGKAEVSGYNYTAKVKVVVDADGNIVSVSDNGTDAGSNEMFWGMAQDMFARFGAKGDVKTKAEVEALKTTPGGDDAAKVDAVSNATYSSDAIKKAVLDALSNGEESGPEVEAPKLELGMFAKQVNEPKSYAGTVRLEASAADGLTIRYTTDGSEPTAESPETSGTITAKELTEEGKIAVKAAAFDQDGNKSKTASLWIVYTRAGEDKNYISGDYEGEASGVTASVEISNLGAYGTPSIQAVKLDDASEKAYADFLPELLSDVYLEQTADVATLSDYDEEDQQKVLDAIKAALETAVEEGGGAASGAINIGGTAYDSIDAALEAAESGDTLEINEDIKFANNADGYANLPEKDLSIQSAEGEQFSVDAEDNAQIVQNGALSLDDVQWNANRHYANGYAFTAGQNVKMSIVASIGSGSRVIAGGAYDQGTDGDDAQLTFSSGKWDVVPGSDDNVKMTGNVTVLANGTSELWVSALPEDAVLDGDINITVDGTDGAKLKKLQVLSKGTKVTGNITVKLIGKVDLSNAYDSTLDITPDADDKVGTLDLSEAEISAEDIKKFSGYENVILPEGQTAAAFAAEGVFTPVSFSLDASLLKDTYEVGEKIDLNDLVVLASYADGSTQELSWKEAKKAGFTADQSTVYTVKKADAENGEVAYTVSFKAADGTELEESFSLAVSEKAEAEEAEKTEAEAGKPEVSEDAEKAEESKAEESTEAEKAEETEAEVSKDTEKAEEAEADSAEGSEAAENAAQTETAE